MGRRELMLEQSTFYGTQTTCPGMYGCCLDFIPLSAS